MADLPYTIAQYRLSGRKIDLSPNRFAQTPNRTNGPDHPHHHARINRSSSMLIIAFTK